MSDAPLLIRNGRVVDPANGTDVVRDLFIENGVFAPVPDTPPAETETLDAAGHVVAPGLIDIHVHLREPGKEQAETIETGSRAAARGGFTTILAMPNTTPPLDTPERVQAVLERGKEVGLTRVLTTACLTKGREGREVADLQALADAGASAFTDDGSTVFERETMRAAMEQAFSLDKVVMDHAEDRDVAHGGVMHQGPYAEQWNLPGIPDYTEARTVLRDAELAEETGCRMHIQHLSAHESLEYVRRARTRGVPVTAELTPHHAALIDANIDPDNANFKMNPPLRSKRDRESLLKGLADGNITALATDHAPHTAEEKAGGFLKAPFGIVGLETAVGVTYTTLVLGGVFDLETWLARWTTGPAAILGLPAPSLADGSPADLVLLDLEDVWTVDPSAFASKSSNTPFAGRELTGRAVCTILGGRITWREPGRQTA